METKRIILAAGLGLMAIIVFTQVRKLGTPPPAVETQVAAPIIQQVEYVDVLVAAKSLPLGGRITDSALKWKKWPAEALTPSFISNDTRPQAMVELDNAIVRSPIVEGEPINENKLVKAGDSGVMAALLKPGMRAVTTRISVDTAAGGFIQPGDHVDIILTRSAQQSRLGSSGTQTNERIFISDTIFENVLVLAIDQTFSSTADAGATVIGSTATFEMSPQDAELLQQSVAKGDLSLTLRGIINSRARVRSTATRIKDTEDESSTLVVYRGGQPQQVAIRGQ